MHIPVFAQEEAHPAITHVPSTALPMPGTQEEEIASLAVQVRLNNERDDTPMRCARIQSHDDSTLTLITSQ